MSKKIIVALWAITGLIVLSAVTYAYNPPTKNYVNEKVGLEYEVTEKVAEAIPFTTDTKPTADLYAGDSRTVQQGQNGSKELTYSVHKKSGQEVGKVLLSTLTTQQPVQEIREYGTKSKPNTSQAGYYNTYGNWTPSPSYENYGDPSALCADGTYSYSQSRSGTCSHHGGVNTWY